MTGGDLNAETTKDTKSHEGTKRTENAVYCGFAVSCAGAATGGGSETVAGVVLPLSAGGPFVGAAGCESTDVEFEPWEIGATL